MPTWLRWILAVGILLLLLAIFIITYILYKKTPVPKECENLEKPSEEKCHGCNETGCHFNLYYNDPAEEKKDATKVDEEKSEEKKE